MEGRSQKGKVEESDEEDEEEGIMQSHAIASSAA